jgi:hypothetical protein
MSGNRSIDFFFRKRLYVSSDIQRTHVEEPRKTDLTHRKNTGHLTKRFPVVWPCTTYRCISLGVFGCYCVKVKTDHNNPVVLRRFVSFYVELFNALISWKTYSITTGER